MCVCFKLVFETNAAFSHTFRAKCRTSVVNISNLMRHSMIYIVYCLTQFTSLYEIFFYSFIRNKTRIYKYIVQDRIKPCIFFNISIVSLSIRKRDHFSTNSKWNDNDKKSKNFPDQSRKINRIYPNVRIIKVRRNYIKFLIKW